MSLFDNFNVAGSAMNAQSLRLNLVASNMANADTITQNPDEAYRARHPLFQQVLQDADNQATGVRMVAVVENQSPIPVRHQPGHPLADENGNIYSSNVNMVEQMVDMISASRSYQSNVEVFNTSKQLLLQTLRLGS
ncbi:MAG TPA: flagellar basal body rod protein FlgC [Gammaproteobacteria bacterium]|nr:flagellar basal body rod protein FlgC [Gammaproteobacteria bacterium]